MTKEEAIKILKFQRGYFCDLKGCQEQQAFTMAIKALEQQLCEDCISRSSITEILNKMDRYVADELTLCDTERKFPKNEVFIVDDVYEEIVEGPPSIKLRQRIGEWRRMSDLPEDEDDRYQCSRCGNVVHYLSKENLYTFNRWCGRCGSNNDRR